MTCQKNTVVLLVEDEPLIRMVSAESLQDEGFEVVEAANADEALEVLRSRADVGLLFTDVNMPGRLDGLALAEMVYRLWPSIKLVVTSGRRFGEPLPDDGRFLGKPYDLSAMTRLITEVSASAHGGNPP
jgi:CheY-like chemotaxis protein